jgi:hypothetical protein
MEIGEYRQTEGGLRGWLRTILGKRGKPTKFAAERGLCDETVLGFLRAARPPEPGLLDAIGYRREYRYTPCPCYRCTKARTDLDPGPMQFGQSIEMQRMFLCETCGNKRCPHAADHRHACTNSNEPGQAGSLYETAPQQPA